MMKLLGDYGRAGVAERVGWERVVCGEVLERVVAVCAGGGEGVEEECREMLGRVVEEAGERVVGVLKRYV